MSELLITEVGPEDVLGIRELLRETWLDTYPRQGDVTKEDVEQQWADATDPEKIKIHQEYIRDLSPQHKQLVVKDGEKIVGWGYFKREKSINILQAIYVLPEYQKRGIGNLLWGRALSFFDPNKDITLEVAVKNAQAISFYKKLGFEDTGERFSDIKYKKWPSGNEMILMNMIRKASKTSV